MPDPVPAEMVGATEGPLTLAADRATASIALQEPAGPAKESLVGGTPRRRAYLNLENITADDVPHSYAIYLNLPEGADPKANRQLYVGLTPAFGVAEASRADEHSAGHGLQHAYEVTPILEWLTAHGGWNPNELQVTFVPRSDDAAKSAPVRVGRTSLFYR